MKNSGNNLGQMADAFHKAEKTLQINPIGVGGYNVSHDTGTPTSGFHKPQSPAQHASVKKAGAVSAAKRKAGANMKGAFGNPKAGGKVFGF